MSGERNFVVLNELVGPVSQKPKRKRRNYSIGSNEPPTWGAKTKTVANIESAERLLDEAIAIIGKKTAGAK